MAIEFPCPHCQRKLRVPDDTAGRSARCPSCSQLTEIPAAAAGPDVSPHTPSPPGSTTPEPTPFAPEGENAYTAPHAAAYTVPTRWPNDGGARPVQSPLASRGRRLAGAILDGLIRVGIVMLGLIAPLMIFLLTGGDAGEDLLIVVTLGFLAIGALVGAGINWYLITISGQSIAKRWLGMRIVKTDDEALPGFLNGVLLRMWVPALINQACGMFSLVDVLFIFGEDQRCVHDLIASTNVIDVATERRDYS